MTDFNKGDFTQQGVDGHVNAKLRLNAKRYVDIDLTSNEEASGCTISGHVYDSLNDITYPIGSAPSGNIEITENTAEGSPLNIAQYATATVNVAGGGGDTFPHCKAHAVNNNESELVVNGVLYDTGIFSYEITLQPNESVDILAFYYKEDNKVFLVPDPNSVPIALPSGWVTNLSNIQLNEVSGGLYEVEVIDPTTTSSCTIDARFFEPAQ